MLDSTLRINSGFLASVTWILDFNRQRILDSRFHQAKIPGFWNVDYLTRGESCLRNKTVRVFLVISNWFITSCLSIQVVIMLVIKQIGLPLRGFHNGKSYCSYSIKVLRRLFSYR